MNKNRKGERDLVREKIGGESKVETELEKNEG